MAPDNYRFAEGDSLLCYHGPMLYEAKCLKRRKANDGKAQYFIHYKGWNSKWEEWVDDNRVLAVNAANMNKMASLKEIHSNAKKSGGKRSITIVKEETIRNVVTPPIKGKKRKYSEVSTELNVSSPAESKPKKRGRPPKIITPKIEETEPTKSVDTTKVTETDVVTESTESTESTEENKVIDKATKEVCTAKEEDTTKKQDTTILVDTAKKEDTSKKENTPKKYNTPKKDNALKKYDTPKKEDILNKDIAPKNDDSPKKENAPRKKDSPKKEDAPTKEDTLKKVEVIKSIDKATEEVLDTKKVEVNKNIEATKKEEETTETADEEIKVLGKVANTTEESEKNKAVESFEETKDIEKTDTIKEVEGSEIVKKIEETETENAESIKESEAEKLEGEELEGVELEGEELEGKELEGEELEGGELEGEELEGGELEGEELEGEGLEGEEAEGEEFDDEEVEDEEAEDEEAEDEEAEGEEAEDEELSPEDQYDNYATMQLLKKFGEFMNVTQETTKMSRKKNDDRVIRTFEIPDIIKKRIAFDYCMIVEFKRELKLLKTNSIDCLLNDYAKYEPNPEVNRTIRLTVIQYFNMLVHRKLLYTPEKTMELKSEVTKRLKQRLSEGDELKYNTTLYPVRLWHFLYGPSHLIRLFVLLPRIFESFFIYEEYEVDLLVKRWENFILFVANNFDKYFSKNGEEDYLPKE